ncbi:MAG: hypothetical protein ACFFAS_07140 [Promethearchaeota archaeon]
MSSKAEKNTLLTKLKSKVIDGTLILFDKNSKCLNIDSVDFERIEIYNIRNKVERRKNSIFFEISDNKLKKFFEMNENLLCESTAEYFGLVFDDDNYVQRISYNAISGIFYVFIEWITCLAGFSYIVEWRLKELEIDKDNAPLIYDIRNIISRFKNEFTDYLTKYPLSKVIEENGDLIERITQMGQKGACSRKMLEKIEDYLLTPIINDLYG